MFSIPVLIDKDGWDITIAVTNIFSAIISAASIGFIYWCSAIRSDQIKKFNEEKSLLEYLLINVHRYLIYMIDFRKILYSKVNHLKFFIDDPDNMDKRKLAFAKISPLRKFDIELVKYDFTIKEQPSIVDDIAHIQQIYQNIATGIEHLNNASERCITINLPQEVVIKTAKELITEDNTLYALDILVSTTSVILERIFENLNKYKINNKHKDRLEMILTDEEKFTLNEMKNLLENENCNEWKYCLNKPEQTKNKHWYEEIFQKRTKKKKEKDN